MASDEVYNLRSSVNIGYVIFVPIDMDNLYPSIALKDQATRFKHSVKRRGQRASPLEINPTPIEFNSAGDLNSTFSESYYLGVSTLCLINLQSQ